MRDRINKSWTFLEIEPVIQVFENVTFGSDLGATRLHSLKTPETGLFYKNYQF